MKKIFSVLALSLFSANSFATPQDVTASGDAALVASAYVTSVQVVSGKIVGTKVFTRFSGDSGLNPLQLNLAVESMDGSTYNVYELGNAKSYTVLKTGGPTSVQIQVVSKTFDAELTPHEQKAVITVDLTKASSGSVRVNDEVVK